MNIGRVIEHLGYTPKEARVYLSLLQSGESHLTDISERTELPRSTTEVVLRKLHKHGLVSCYERRGHKYWVAERPERLLDIHKEHEKEFSEVIPRLRSLRGGGEKQFVVNIYRGVDEIKLIYDDIIVSRQPLRAIIPWDESLRVLGKEFLEEVVERRAKNFLKMDLLAPRSPASEELQRKDNSEYRRTRFLPPGVAITTTNIIYGNKVAFISLCDTPPSALLINDADIAHTMTEYFLHLWRTSADK